MPDFIYTVDPMKKAMGKVQPVTFSEIGVKERADLEEWVIAQPDLLGEDLLIVTTEFDRFDRSDKRLDLLAIDKSGRLVVVELKLELVGAPADQQAIRYAAFVSTMTWEEIVAEFAAWNEVPAEEATQTILEFVGQEELPVLDGRPRIILAAGQLDDPELTSVALWLRGFEVDITCVELTPYRLPGKAEILLVPRVIIPLPEAKEYVVRVERRDAERAVGVERKQKWRSLWRLVNEKWNATSPELLAEAPPGAEHWHRLPFGGNNMEYHWAHVRREGSMRAYLLLKHPDARRLALFNGVVVPDGGPGQIVSRAGTKNPDWIRIEVGLPDGGATDDDQLAAIAVKGMKVVFDATWPILQKHGLA